MNLYRDLLILLKNIANNNLEKMSHLGDYLWGGKMNEKTNIW
ncbi:hypothetical protein SMU81_02687 [Streptococcus mutans SF14]|nr:hypothetical protein SMU81_02687 [Streptococcus mutans SF14]